MPAGYVSFIRPITSDTATALLRTCSELIAQHGVDTLHLLISSEGGNLIPGFGAYEQLRALPVQLITHNIGSVNSIANIVFLAGERRLATPISTFLFHGTQWNFTGGASVVRRQIVEIAASLTADEDRMKAIIIERSRLSDAEASDLMLEGSTRGAQFALEKGIINEIENLVIPPASIIRQV